MTPIHLLNGYAIWVSMSLDMNSINDRHVSNNLLIYSTKTLVFLIKLSLNAPKSLRGLDALTISPFLVIDENFD